MLIDRKIRRTQLKVLNIFKKHSKTFALGGGTALELFYLKHRFSKDLDFFSADYSAREIQRIIQALSKEAGSKITLENQFESANKAKVRFYLLHVQGYDYPLKIDFIEEVFFTNPEIKRFKSIPVYSSEQIYLQKIMAITGGRLSLDAAGRNGITGRGEIRDVVDVYYLSKKIRPLHEFLRSVPRVQQRGMVQWYRSYSRHEFKIGYMDFEVYDTKLYSTDIIRYLDDEIEAFIGGMIE